MVSLSYGHGHLDDCDNADPAVWVETETGLAATIATDGDVFTITGTCDNAADEYAYYEKDITNILSATYTKYYVRWKTSDASNGCGLQVQLIFTDGSQYLLDANVGVPQYSTVWTVTSGTITTGKTIDKIRIILDDYPNTIEAGTFSGYVDFVLLCKGSFTFPNIGHELSTLLEPRMPNLDMPSKSGDSLQGLGTHGAEIQCVCDLNTGTWTRATDTIPGQVFYDVWHNSKSEPFQWLDTGDCAFKAAMTRCIIQRNSMASEAEKTANLTFKEYRLGNTQISESYAERMGI